MKDWMRVLADHYQQTRESHPQDQLLILFDIDGTVLDMREMILHLLKAYDRAHETHHAIDLKREDIQVHENDITPLLNRMPLLPEEKESILQWFNNLAWSPLAVRVAHRPYHGVLEIIRWFQMQPNTYVGLNSGRSERLRADTLKNLNRLGEEFKVSFSDELLAMNDGGSDDGAIASAKIEAIRKLRNAGYRIVAMVDNEPANLAAIADSDVYEDFLLLHADTLFESQRSLLPSSSANGRAYQLTEFMRPDTLPKHVEFVFQGLQSPELRKKFYQGSIFWGEITIQQGEQSRMPEIASNSLLQSPAENGNSAARNEWLQLLQAVANTQRGLKINLGGGGVLLDKLIRDLRNANLPSEHIWIDGPIQLVREAGVRKLRNALPKAVLQCTIDPIRPLVRSLPDHSRNIIDELRNWGINRFSFSWHDPASPVAQTAMDESGVGELGRLVDMLQQMGLQTNIHGVPDLESFLRASLLLPTSICSSFDNQNWLLVTERAPAVA